ncbi:hypothetical protein ACQ4PT_036603 [Festuca glaucescens]
MEKGRRQAEENQARMMQTHAKMLEQIATRLAEPRVTRETRKESGKPRWGDFHKTNPSIFASSDEPLDADDWLRDIERRLKTIECSDKEKVLFATHQLQGPAAAWWINYQETSANPDEITWEQFVSGFRKEHIPTGILSMKHREFLDLKQGGQSLKDYLNKYNYLARYAPDDVNTDAKKMEQFEHGLQDSLKYHISSHAFPDFQTMINSLLKTEKVKEGMAEDRGQKKEGTISQHTNGDDSTKNLYDINSS